METEVANCSVDKKYFEIEKNELILENDRLLEHIIYQDIMNVIVHADVHNVLSANNSCLDNDNLALELLKIENDRLIELLISQDLVHTAVNSLAAINDYKSMAQTQFKDKDVSIEKLKEHIANLGRKNVVESATTMANSNVITLKVYKLDLQPLSPRIKNNRDARIDYLKVTQEHTKTLRDIVEQARALKHLNNVLDYAYKYTQQIQELLVCVCASCPRVSSSTEASGSNPKSNTKKYRITQTSSSNKKKNKVEDHPRISKSSLNNKNHVSKPVCNANVKHSMLNAISELVCATCNELVPHRKSISTTVVKQTKPSSNESGKLKDLTNIESSSKSKIVGRTNRTVIFGNDQIAKIMGYGDYQLGNVTISQVYYVEGLGHNLLMPVESINGKKYILVIIDDYSIFTWVKFLRSKDETLEIIIKCLKQIQVRLNATVRNVRTDTGTVFVNQTLKDYYENVRITHQTSVERTPQ
ncbi:retrovirus-related pol polyprotein from transposon TNT 1-94 [Tanacetum coccineum]|uniref:Retrovirus-related pol polyprotein from transposon TNT 1-94 n=1 Tax=Tanacetum coccineum TaxID=301880 RepID=A0ABQ5A7S6_9ASTR